MTGSKQVFGICTLLAVLLHALVLQFRIFPNLRFESAKKNATPIEIERLPSEEKKPVVQTSRALEQATDEIEAKFHAEFKNRVETETQSGVAGKFQEGQIITQAPLPEELRQKELERSKDALAEIPEEENPAPQLSDLMVIGRNPHELPDSIKKGPQTLLNTDKVVYASFINRIAEEIYQPWVDSITDAIKTLNTTGRKLDPTTYITKLRIVMDKEGSITGIQTVASSGVSEIDEAPKKAFWHTEPFPNPPIQLLEEDGFIRLVYEFHFEWKSSGFSIVPWTI